MHKKWQDPHHVSPSSESPTRLGNLQIYIIKINITFGLKLLTIIVRFMNIHIFFLTATRLCKTFYHANSDILKKFNLVINVSMRLSLMACWADVFLLLPGWDASRSKG